MKKHTHRFRNEKGAVSIEFLGILPYYFFFFLFLWQVVASGYAVMTAQSAVNEAAKVYALSGRVDEAIETAESIVGNSSIADYQNLNINLDPNGRDFTATILVNHGLVFVPEDWRPAASLQISHDAKSRVIE